jgi:methylenetetrahydrofolate--tRNA-(uracil-5-)-methyltransferase
MKANFGILPPLEEKIKDKRKRNSKLAEKALKSLNEFVNQINLQYKREGIME